MRGRESMLSQYGSVNHEKESASKHKQTIERLYLNEFEDGLSTIFQDSESSFLYKIINRVKLAVGEYMRKVNCEEKTIRDLIKSHDEKLMDKYYFLKKNFLRYLNEFKKASNLKLTEFLFRKHCNKCPEVPMHSCQNRLLVIKENNEPKYLLCTECKIVFSTNSMILYCKPCSTEFYSSLVNTVNDTEIHPATWQNYHCGSVFNDQMRCIKCTNFLFLRNSDNLLVCLKCNFTSDPKKIVWICSFCKVEFQSAAKIYNPLEFKSIKLAIKDALINKKVGVPENVPCCGEKAYSLVFLHKKSCPGELYVGDLSGKRILVCSKCKSISNMDGFVWTCPKCDGKFKADIKRKESRNNNINLPKERSLNALDQSITPVKLKHCDTGFQKINKDSLSPFLKKGVIPSGKSPEMKETLENFRKIIINKEDNDRNNSMHRIRNHKINLDKNDSNLRFTGNLVPMKEEESMKMVNELITEAQEIIADIKPEKISNVSKFELKRNDLNPNCNSKNSNSSNNNNNETSDSLNATSSKNNLQYLVPVPNRDKCGSRLINLNILNADETTSAIEKEVSDDNINKNLSNKGNKSILSTPESVRNKEKNLINLNKDNPIKKVSTPVLLSKSNYNVIRSPEMKNGQSTPQKSARLSVTVDEEKEVYTEPGPLVNFNIEDFKIISNIGEGSFGVIYSTENALTKEKFAMKKMLVNNEEDLKIIQNEFELINKFPHKNILKIYGLCSKTLDFSTKVLYIQMELAVSDWDKEIKNRFKSSNFYKESELVNILHQIVKALGYLQKKGISHRDVKPQNILIFPENIYKVADFGEAKEVTMTNKQLNTLRGTELYMSPILFTTLRNTNKNNVNHNIYKSDVFSLGYCILYAATLSFKILYDLRHVNNQKYVINIIKNYLSKKYSSNFIDCVSKMVDVKEESRYDFIELNKELKENFSYL